VVSLVDRDNSIYNLRLDGLLIDNRLDSLIDVIIDVLTNSNTGVVLYTVYLYTNSSVLKLSGFTYKTLFRFALVLVVELAILN